MQELKLWYNNHRKKIWVIVGIIAAVIICIQLLNYFVSRNNDNVTTNIYTSNDTTTQIENGTNINLESTQSAVSGQEVSKDKLESETTVIGKFMDSCNNGNIEEAYNLLTDECKEQMYNSLENFEQTYYQDVFEGQNKIYTVENWTGSTYKVDISEDILATGKSNNGYVKQDYITVKENNGEYKLNINNYIEHRDINKNTEKEDIIMNVISKNVYMDREEYTIRVTNNKDTAITLDGMSNAKSLYLEDSKGATYSAYTHELTSPMLNIESGETKELTIKFYSRYVSTKIIDDMVFSDLIVYNAQGSETIEFRANI